MDAFLFDISTENQEAETTKMDRDARRAQKRAWYLANKQLVIAKQVSRYRSDSAHRAKVIADAKAWYLAHRDEVRARKKAQRAAASSASVSPG
jgi:hypothetical protein